MDGSSIINETIKNIDKLIKLNEDLKKQSETHKQVAIEYYAFLRDRLYELNHFNPEMYEKQDSKTQANKVWKTMMELAQKYPYVMN